MSDIVSSNLANGAAITAAQMNQLRDDLLKNHDHSGGNIDHANLVDGVIPGTYLDHATLDKHIGAVADAAGGSVGVHGLGASAYVAGSLGGQFVWQVGTAVTSGIEEVASGWLAQVLDLEFTDQFSTPPEIVLICPSAVGLSHPEAAAVAVRNVTERGCQVRIKFEITSYNGKSQRATTFYWMALGRR